MKKLFTNDKFFLATVLIAIIGTLIFDVANWAAFPDSRSSFIMDVLSVICVLILYTSYKKHSKNVMKCVIGALLMLILLVPINSLTLANTVQFPAGALIVMVFQVLFAAGLFISHNLVNSDHHSNGGFIRFNQLLCIALAICHIVCVVLMLQFNENVLLKVVDFIGSLGYACMVASIVCVESRLDAYRLDRENAGWTEEKGYPKNYVHEYEKK